GSAKKDEGGGEGQAPDTVSVGLVADPDYYGGSANLDSLIVTSFSPDTDPEDLMRMNVGLITEVPPGYESPDGWSALNRPNLDHHVLMYNLANPVLSDERVRRAISAAVDKEGIVDRVFSGDAELLSACEVPTTGERREGENREGNVERGLSLLADAGFLAPEAGSNSESESDVELVMISDSQPRRVEVSRLIAEHIELLGISVNLEVLERSDYYERMRSGDYDLSYWVLVPELVDPLAYTANFRSDNYWNVSQIWDNPEMRDLQERIDEVLVGAAGVYDEEERMELLADFAEMVTENHLYSSLWNTSIRGLIRDEVRGVRVPYGNDFDLDRAHLTNPDN
ncbi:MAG: ABC transporter substrate-binding protein, partial [Bacillota bacterium]